MQYLLILAEITDFDKDGTLKGLSYHYGRLKVRKSGAYYIYAQVFFQAHHGEGRVTLSVNGNTVSTLLTSIDGTVTDYGNRFTGVLKKLTKGDQISVKRPHLLWSYANR